MLKAYFKEIVLIFHKLSTGFVVEPSLNALLHKKQSQVINSRALTSKKPCINKAIHALLMHSYATFNMPLPGPQNCCHHEMCSGKP